MTNQFWNSILLLAIFGSSCVTAQTSSTCDTTAYATCAGDYGTAVNGVSDVNTICDAFKIFKNCAISANCQSEISMTDPCSSTSVTSGAIMISGSIVLTLLLTVLQFIKRL